MRTPRSRRVARFGLILAGAAVLVVIGGLLNPAFVTADNGLAILRAASLSGIVALGATFITLSGRFFSLALGNTVMFTGIVLAVTMSWGVPFYLALVLTFIVAMVIGAVQGAIVAMGSNPIITTLGAGALLAGVAGLATNGVNVPIRSEAVAWIGNARIVGVPTQTWAFVIAIAIAWWVIRKTRFGHETVLLGANPASARASGLSAAKITITVYTIASVASAVAGILAAAQFSKARVQGFSTMDFDIIAAVLIGGTAIQGGRGSPLPTALGAVAIATIQNYMLLLSWSSGVRTMITGAFIVLIVVGFHLAGKRVVGFPLIGKRAGA